MKERIKMLLYLVIAPAFLVACAKTEDSAAATTTTAATAAATTCETTYQTVSSPANGYQALCKPEAGNGKFYRIEGTNANATNKYFYVVLGDSDANRVGTNTPAPSTTSGDGRFILNLGASAGGAGWTWFSFNGNSTTQYTYDLHTVAPLTVRGPSTVCFEITDTTPPQLTFWVTGQKTDGSAAQTGMTADATVDCANTATLTRANAVFVKVDWNNVAALASGSAYIKSSGTDTVNIAKATKVFVSSNEVIGATDVCATTPGTGTTQVCNPSQGTARHFRIEGVQTSIAHSSVTLYTGYNTQPVGGDAATTNGQGKFVFYHGNGGAPPAQTSVAYSNQTGTMGTAFNGFSTAASEVCMDVTNATPPRITLWATGVNTADCKNRTTLTAANSLINKSDWTTAVAGNATAGYIYRGSAATASKVTAYSTIAGTGF